MKIRITELHPNCLWKNTKWENEIMNSEFEVITIRNSSEFDGWCYGEFVPKKSGVSCISGFKYIEVPEPSINEKIQATLTNKVTAEQLNKIHGIEPSAMSELSGWIDENTHANCMCDVSTYEYDFSKPKKPTWIQKIRGYDIVLSERNSWIKRYDDLQARCNSAEAMRDHYKEVFTVASISLGKQASIITEKSRELKLMEIIADTWQQRLICVQKDYADVTEMIGKRLKFSVGHNHITITIGNPITLCENFISSNKKLEWSISKCSRKDVYDWKQGVIHAVDNYCDEHKSAEKLRRDLRKSLAKKYPEVFR